MVLLFGNCNVHKKNIILHVPRMDNTLIAKMKSEDTHKLTDNSSKHASVKS